MARKDAFAFAKAMVINMKEKRYEIYKRGELPDRSPEGINALGAPDSSVNGDILENSARYETAAPRSSLNNNMFNEQMNRKAPDYKPFGNPKGNTPGVAQKGTRNRDHKK